MTERLDGQTMPEGDTIFRSARALGRAFIGSTVTRFETAYADLARANDDHPFAGQAVTHIEARGKWLLIHFSGGADGDEAILATHMLMSGSWHIYRPGERWQMPHAAARIVFESADYVAVAFRVPLARMHTPYTLARDRKIPKSEADVLSETFNAADAAARLLSHTDLQLADALLRQNVLAGVGNVFKSEICFLLGLSPFQPVATLTAAQADAIVAMAQKLLAANVLEDSGSQIVTYQGRGRRTTRNEDPGDNLWVYARKGEPCRRCGTPIERCLQGPNARSTYWCPTCQPLISQRPA